MIHLVEFWGYDGYGILYASLDKSHCEVYLSSLKKLSHYNYIINSYPLNTSLDTNHN